MIELKDVDERNWLEAMNLSVDEEQKGFLASAVGIIARGYVFRKDNARVFAVENDGEYLVTKIVIELAKGNDIEKSADQFASYFLMPLGNEVIYKIEEEISFNKIIELEQYYKVSHQAMLYRLLGEGLISSEQLENYKNRKVVYAAASLGFDTALYKPSLEEKAYKTFGYYIKQAQRLLENEKISDGKYEQLLLEAFRSDLVYGEDQEEEELND